jgi:hypothetical protein
MAKFWGAVAIIILAILFSLIASKAIGQTERNECLKWEKMSKEYPGYKSTGWQLEQCSARGLELKK